MSSNIERLSQEFKDLEDKYQTLASIHYNKATNYKMLILGVVLGLIGGLFSNVFYDLAIEPTGFEYRLIVLILSLIIFSYLLINFFRKMTISQYEVLKVKNERDNILSSLNKLAFTSKS